MRLTRETVSAIQSRKERVKFRTDGHGAVVGAILACCATCCISCLSWMVQYFNSECFICFLYAAVLITSCHRIRLVRLEVKLCAKDTDCYAFSPDVQH